MTNIKGPTIFFSVNTKYLTNGDLSLLFQWGAQWQQGLVDLMVEP